VAASFAELLERFEPIGLDALDAQAALQQRVDQKYLVAPADLEPLLERMLQGFVALEIDGRRQSLYESVYFDTPALRCYRDHVDGYRPRLKVRTRLYVETRVCALEAKLKRADDEMDKASCTLDPADHGRITAAGLRFLEDAVGGDAPHVSLVELGPALTTRYRRATLAAREGGVRVTFDDDVRASLPGGARGELTPGQVIVETKSADGESEADALLREAGQEPTSLSKYRAGIDRLVPAGER
jgi:hypothetical protein